MGRGSGYFNRSNNRSNYRRIIRFLLRIADGITDNSHDEKVLFTCNRAVDRNASSPCRRDWVGYGCHQANDCLTYLIGNPIARWAAVVPGAFLAAVAAMFPWHWAVLFYASFIGEPEGGSLGLGFLVRLIGPEDVERTGYGFLTPFVLICVAARIAPQFKHATAVAMSSLVVLWWVFNWTILRGLLEQQGLYIEVVQGLVANGLAVLAIWVALKYARSWWEQSPIHEDARNPLHDAGYVRMYWESIMAQETGENQYDWIYDDKGRILGPLDHESGRVMTVEEFVLKMNEPAEDDQ